MNRNVIVSCAVTGSGANAVKNPELPITPEQIATAAIESAKAGAAIVHLHVRDPDTGMPSRRLDLYREVVARIRESETDVIINLTTGMGGDLYMGEGDNPLEFTADTDCVAQRDRMEHIIDLLPEISTIDCGSFNYPVPNYVYVSTVGMLREGAKLLQDIGVKPELEIFDMGQMWFVQQLIAEGLIDAPALIQICLGIKWGAPATPTVFKAMTEMLPEGCNWGGFGVGAMQMPMVAQAALLGGNVRVGLEDNLYLEKGVYASNTQLVERAVELTRLMGCSIQSPAEARATLGLTTPK